MLYLVAAQGTLCSRELQLEMPQTLQGTSGHPFHSDLRHRRRSSLLSDMSAADLIQPPTPPRQVSSATSMQYLLSEGNRLSQESRHTRFSSPLATRGNSQVRS